MSRQVSFAVSIVAALGLTACFAATAQVRPASLALTDDDGGGTIHTDLRLTDDDGGGTIHTD